MRTYTLAPVRTAHLVRGAAAAALLIGYADLLRGGTTLAPLLLVLAYVGLVPAVIFSWR